MQMMRNNEVKVNIIVDSISGNTMITAEEIERVFYGLNYELGYDKYKVNIWHLQKYPFTDFTDIIGCSDVLILGTWTCDYGAIPPDMEEFVEDNIESLRIVAKDKNLHFFGTGETQWGMEHFCGAINKLKALFFEYKVPPMLKIEQLPANKRQFDDIEEWVEILTTKFNELSTVDRGV